jgi:transposase
MTPRKRKDGRFPVPASAEPLKVVHRHAAGIDVHSREHWVAVPADAVPATAPRNPDRGLPEHVRRFGACTADLQQLADFLRQCGVTTVAMESTGVYWVPLFELLERLGFEVFLVDPRQTKQVTGRPKTDRLDCQWIQKLHSYGLLSGSFRPADQVVVLRSYLRQRHMLIRYGASHVHHMQKALEQMNVKLPEVVSDITGMTGMAIIEAILAGERDPARLAKHRREQCHRSEAEIARALLGNWREDHLFALQQAVTLYRAYQEQLRLCDHQIDEHLRGFADQSAGTPLSPKPRRRKRRANEPAFDARASLFRMSGVDLTVIEGIEASTALAILAEIGLDMSKWPTEKHFTSWLGLCPQRHGSGRTVKGRQSRPGRNTNRAALAFRLAAQGCHRAKNALGAYYRRIQARAGGPKAVAATARKIAERVYRLLKYGAEYVRLGEEAYTEAYRKRVLQGLSRRARELGYHLVPAPSES